MRFMYRLFQAAVSAALVWVVAGGSFAAAADELNGETLRSSSWWAEAQKNLREQAHEISWQEGPGALQAVNRAANLRAFFRTSGVELVPRTDDPDWRWRLTLTGMGRAGALGPITPVEPCADGRLVEYQHARLTEWYLNRDDGIEQGITIFERPQGSGALIVEVRVSGDLESRLDVGGQSISFLREGETVLSYGKLKVEDADGRVLSSWLTLDGDDLRIVIDDDGRYPVYVDPLMTTPSWMEEGDQDGARYGFSVSSAGDVNGDTYDDVIVGAYFYDNGQADEGRAFVYHGSASGLSTTPDWMAESDQVVAWFGWSVSGAGDVNGDTYDDVIVGAYKYDNGELSEGRAYVFHGSASGLSTTADWTAEGNQFGASFGFSVSNAGDVNGDTYADVIIGASFYDNGETSEGRAFVYHGSASGLSTTADWMAESNQLGASLGYSVSGAGDVNGDTYDDVIVGAVFYDNGEPDEGAAFVYHGSAAGLSLTYDWMAESDQASAEFGYSVSKAGDVNGDTYDDVIVGAPSYDKGGVNEGRAFVYHGSATGLSTVADWTTDIDQTNAQFGIAVASAGNVNGDAYDDVIVGARGYSNGESGEGGAFAYHGSPLGLLGAPSWTGESNQASAEFGISVSSAGDVNGDTYDDVIVGAYLYGNGESDEGAAFVYRGDSNPTGIVKPPPATTSTVLRAVHPNPFNPSTTVTYFVPRAGWLRILIFDVEGKRVRTLWDGHTESGDHSLEWNGIGDNNEQAPSGVYFFRLEFETDVAVVKGLLLK